MLKNKKGATFVSVVGTAIFITIIATLVFSFVGNNGLLVNKYANMQKSYNKTSDALISAANYLVEKSSSEDINNAALVNLVNNKLNLPENFGIDEITDENIKIVPKDEANGVLYKGKQIKLTLNTFYINVFLSDDGTQKSLSNIFFDNTVSLDFVYKTGFLTASYIYENDLYFYEDNAKPIKYALAQTDTASAASLAKDLMYEKLLPQYDKDDEKRVNFYFELNKEENIQYKEKYIDDYLIDYSIAECIPTDNYFSDAYTKAKTWNDMGKPTTFIKNQTYFIKGDVVLKEAGTSANEIILEDNATVYIEGNLNMDHSAEKKGDRGTIYPATKLTLGKGATLIIGSKKKDNNDFNLYKVKDNTGNLIIKNKYQMPSITCDEKANIICGGDILIHGIQDQEKTVNNYWYLESKKNTLLGYILRGIWGKYFDSLETEIKGNISGTYVVGNNFTVVTETINSSIELPATPIRATIYADDNIDFNRAFLQFDNTIPAFLFANYINLVGSGDHSFGTLLDGILDRLKTEYFFAIVDKDIDYNGITNTLKANIFTTNQNNTTEIVKKINDAYNTQSGGRIINKIFDLVGVQDELGKIGSGEVKVDVSNLGLPKVLTEGSTDQSYSSNVRK